MSSSSGTDGNQIPDFESWLSDLIEDACREGVPRQAVEDALADAEPRPEIIGKQRSQPEFVLTPARYMSASLSAARIETGQAARKTLSKSLAEIEESFGVPADFLVAIWGLESDFGRFMGDHPVIDSLVTLAWKGNRMEFSKRQLIAALKITASGRRDLVGSWAGAMGHTQFMPESYLRFGVDFSGSGSADIWNSSPDDALASTARALRCYGWIPGREACVEAILPKDFSYQEAGPGRIRNRDGWRKLGVSAPNRSALPLGDAEVLLPAGAPGPAFLIYGNFNSVLCYNRSTSYALGVCLLAKHIGGEHLRCPFPDSEDAMTRQEMIDLQTLLVDREFNTGGIDGIAGPATIAAIRDFQAANDMLADGYPSRKILNMMRMGKDQ